MTEAYLTLGAVGGLTGAFVAGMTVALAQAFPGGEVGGLEGYRLAGVAAGMVLTGGLLGTGMAAMAHGTKAMWSLYRGKRRRRAGSSASQIEGEC